MIGIPVTGPDCAEARFAKSFPTTLKRLSRADFERLVLYGHDSWLTRSRLSDPRMRLARRIHSTVTLFAKLRGLSMSVPRTLAV